MANLLENYGLETFRESEEGAMGLVKYNVENGRAISGYYNVPYILNRFGDMDFLIRTENRGDGTLEVSGLDTHCANKCVWEMVHSGIDISEEDEKKYKRTIMFNRYGTNKGLLPIELITADVLPSFMEDDKITMQVVGLPLRLDYYASEEGYESAQPESDSGKKYLLKNGGMVPLAFLYNHSLERYEQGKYYDSDRYVEFMATVKKLYYGEIEVNGEKSRTFIRCFAETEFGELEFDHTIDQVAKSQWDNIKVGSIICGTCILSGDVAIHEYENGIVKDFDHNLRLLRYTLVEGDPERLSQVLDVNAIYETDHYDRPFSGARAIIDRFTYVRNHGSSEYVAHMAVISEVDYSELEYPVGTKCIVLADGEPDNFESIVFMDVNEEGMITRIKITTDSRYHFEVSSPDYEQINR